MSLFGFGHHKAIAPHLLTAIERAVQLIEPLLIHEKGYPDRYATAVEVAWGYAQRVALAIPGPLPLDFPSYVQVPAIHALFSGRSGIIEAIRSSRSLLEYRHNSPLAKEAYALMGTRLCQKTAPGMELHGNIVQYDVMHEVVYFTNHTLDHATASEVELRHNVTWSIFDRLALLCRKRIVEHRLNRDNLRQALYVTLSKLHTAKGAARDQLDQEMQALMRQTQEASQRLDPKHHIELFEEILLQPEQHIYLSPLCMCLDLMGVRHEQPDSNSQSLIFEQLTGIDRRNWIVTLVHCRDLQNEAFAPDLELATRQLSLQTG